jgi:hypothetical protein
MSPALRTLAEIEAAGAALGAAMRPLTQEEADRVAALLAAYQPALPLPREQDMTAAQAARTAA